jgi:hypothetical protein
LTGVHYHFVKHQMEDWRGAARFIDVRGTEQDKVIITPVNCTYALARNLHRDVLLFGSDTDPVHIEQLVAQTSDAPALWTVFAWDEGGPVQEQIRRALACRYPYREEYRVHQIGVARWHRAERDAGSSVHTSCAQGTSSR